MATGYGGTKESNLITETTLNVNDYVRIVTSGSRKITLADLLAASSDELQSLGFLTSVGNVRLRKVTNVSSTTYTVSVDDDIIFCDATGNDIDLTMPLPTAMFDTATNSSRIYTIKKNDTSSSNVINVIPTGAAEIDGEESIQLIGDNFPYFRIASDGVNLWSV